MFRNASILRGLNPYILFILDHQRNPKLNGLSAPKRAKILSKMYKTLPVTQRASLVRRAARRPQFPVKPKKISTLNLNGRVGVQGKTLMAVPPPKHGAVLAKIHHLKKAVPVSGKKEGKGTVIPSKNLGHTVKNKLRKHEQKSLKHATASHSTKAVKGKVHVSSASAKVKSLMMNKKKKSGH